MDTKIPIIVVGSGGHAKVVIDIIEQIGNYKIVGITTNDLNIGSSFFGYPILGTDDILPDYKKKGIRKIAIGVGGFTDNKLRKAIYQNIELMGFEIETLVHPSAIISPRAKIGIGCVIFSGVVINTDVVLGNNVVIATRSSIDHDTNIEDHALVSAGVTIGANDLVGEGALIAIGSVIVSGKKIGKNCLIAAGAVVVSDVADRARFAGVPAREMKKIK
ncbi:MAG: acetyltransferase [Bacteriovorax sp.]|nr:acetyltransferase [Bacteriovorax sp.]